MAVGVGFEMIDNQHPQYMQTSVTPCCARFI